MRYGIAAMIAVLTVAGVSATDGEGIIGVYHRVKTQGGQKSTCEEEIRRQLQYIPESTQDVGRSGFAGTDLFIPEFFSRRKSLGEVSYDYDIEVEGIWKFSVLENVQVRKGRYSDGSPLINSSPKYISDPFRNVQLGIVEGDGYEINPFEQQKHIQIFLSATCSFYSDKSERPNSVSIFPKLYRG